MTQKKPNRPAGFGPDVVDAMYEEVLGNGRKPNGQFAKGKSGNPDGPPRGTKKAKAPKHGSRIAAKAAEIARRPITVRDADGERTIDAIEAALLQLRKSAASGNVPATRLLVELVSQDEALEQERVAAERAELARLKECWEAYVARTRPLFEAAEANGLPAPEIYPHPDDVVLGDDGQLKIIGPVCPETAKDYAEIASTTDYWLTMIAYDRWRGSRGGPFSNRAEYSYVAEILFWQQQEWLPPRMRMTEAAVVSAVMWLGRLSGRKLHRRLSELGHKANLYVPPWRARLPTTFPTELCLDAHRNGVQFDDFLIMWSNVLVKHAAQAQARETRFDKSSVG